MSFTVTYNANGATGGTVPVDPNVYAAGASVTVLGNTGNLTKGADTFARWNSAADGTGTPYGSPASGTFNISNNVTLYAQWYTTTGLTNNGATAHFQFHYESSLQGLGLEPARTNSVLVSNNPVCENDYQIMAGWFNGITLNPVYPVPLPVYVANLSGGANVQNIITLRPGNGSAAYLRYLYISEITELFMDSQNKGWFAPDRSNEQSCGEGLSRFLAQQFLVLTGLGVAEPGYAISPSWLNSSLPPTNTASTQVGGKLTTLSAAINNTTTSVSVGDAPSVPFAKTFLVQVENETMFVTNVDANSKTMTVTRGYNGTTATAHASNTEVHFNYGPRNDYVNLTLEYDHDIDPGSGCSMLFIYYLNVNLGASINDIISNAPGSGSAATCLRGVYNNWTSDLGDPFPFFKSLLDNAFPPGEIATIPGPNPDNPFPLGSLTWYGAKSTWGSDEVTDILTTSGGLYSQAFWLVLEGFSRRVVGTTVPSNPVVAFPGVTIQIDTQNITYESPNLNIPQRIRYSCNVIFDSSVLPAFPKTGETMAVVTSKITILGKDFPAIGEFFFIAGANPYFTNVLPKPNPADENAPYVSNDLRVFTATPAINAFPVPNGPQFITDGTQGAYDYITALIPWLNGHYGDPSGIDPFDANSLVIPNQQDPFSTTRWESVTPYTTQNGQSYHNYNFAVARVRLRGPSRTARPADGVKVFFRLWGTNTGDTAWNPSYTYLSHNDTDGNPLWPLAPSDNHSVPFFATLNPDFTSPTNGEFGTNGVNNQNISIKQGDAQWAYFGCFLDVYNTDLSSNGVPIVKAFPGDHHCLVAQIAYDNAPIENIGSSIASPETSDKLAQRNLQVTPSDNPGPGIAHRIPQTFDTLFTAITEDHPRFPDELMIDWGNVPPRSIARIYWPQVSAKEIISLATTIYSTHFLSVSDTFTIQCETVEGVTYIPIPFGSGPGLAGLLTIDLPLTVKKGQEFNVVVRRLKLQTIVNRPPDVEIKQLPHTQSSIVVAPRITAFKSIIGSFQVKIPIGTAAQILPGEEDKLAVFKARLSTMSTSDRWYPVLQRYVGYISGRVDGLGGPGTASSVPPSFGGFPVVVVPPSGGEEICLSGHVSALIFNGDGDFDGFLLVTDDEKHEEKLTRFHFHRSEHSHHEHKHEYHIKSREHHVHELVERAWCQHQCIIVCVDAKIPHSLRSIVLREPPADAR